MMRGLTAPTLVVACGLLLAGCTSDGGEAPPEPSATGSVAALPVAAYALDADGDPSLEEHYLTLGDGGFFTLMDGPSLVTAGSYSVNGDELTWDTDSLCAGNDGVEQATYSWALDGDALRLTPKGIDGCTERVLIYSHGLQLRPRHERFKYEATFGEDFTSGDGIWVTVSEPEEFTPSEEVSAMPVWGPLDLEDWDHFVRATVTWRNESRGVAATEWVSVEDGQVILDEASGLEEMAGTPVEAGEEVSFDVGFGVADPTDLQVRVPLTSDWEGPSTTVTFTS